MPEETRRFNAYIRAKEVLKEKLAKANISEEQYTELFTLLDTVTGTDLESVRNEQFANDAYELAVTVQVATSKKQQQISQFLRRFAEHVIRHACQVNDEQCIKDITDHLPSMFVEENE